MITLLRVSFAGLAALALLSSMSTRAAGSEAYPGAAWPQRTPGEAGLDALGLQSLANLVNGSGMIVRDGYQVFTWGDPSQTANWASASKPVLSTLLFAAAAAGSCGMHSPIGDHLAGGNAKDAGITFFQLANMTSGYSRAEAPGAAWAYNDHAIQLFGHVLLEEVWGSAPSVVFANQFSFLRFEDTVEISDSQFGRVTSMSIRDFARIGLFWLNRGTWDDIERIPASYFDLVTNQVPPSLPRTAANGAESWSFGTFGGDDDQTATGPGHFGMCFWVNTNGLWENQPATVYQANGHWGQEVCFVIPSMNVVAVGAGGSWGHPATAALALIIDADIATAASSSSWTAVKSRYIGRR